MQLALRPISQSRWTRPLLIAAALLAMAIAIVGTPTAASAAVSCSGYGCDGYYPDQTQCWNDRYIVYGQHLTYSDGTQIPAVIQFWYSPSCQTTWAYLVNGTSWDPGNGEGCHATIQREWDRSYTEPVDPGIDFAYTKMVYDGGRYSYANGTCDYGRMAGATTPAW